MTGTRSFGEFMEETLYGEKGFYTRGGGAGRRRDFVTSPEVGGLFGAVIANAIDAWWDEAGQPDPFTVVEAGAGPGTLAATVALAKPRCAVALQWILLDRSPAMRALQTTRRLRWAGPDEIRGKKSGPWFISAAQLPPGVEVHVVLANELLDNLAFDIAAYFDGHWSEVRITDDNNEVVVPGDALWNKTCNELFAETSPNDGDRVPLLRGAQQWLGQLLDADPRTRVVMIDYATLTTAELARRSPAWLRVYRGHQRLGSPYESPGSCDITTDIAVDQLADLRRPFIVSTQTEFLRTHSIDGIVERALRAAEASEPNSMASLRLRSFAYEREALVDPDSLGGFLVMEWPPK